MSNAVFQVESPWLRLSLEKTFREIWLEWIGLLWPYRVRPLCLLPWRTQLPDFWPFRSSIRSASDQCHCSSSIFLVFVVTCRWPQRTWRCDFQIPFLSPFLLGSVQIVYQFLDDSLGLKPSVTTALASLHFHLGFSVRHSSDSFSSWLQSLVVRFARVLSAMAGLSYGDEIFVTWRQWCEDSMLMSSSL